MNEKTRKSISSVNAMTAYGTQQVFVYCMSKCRSLGLFSLIMVEKK